MLDVVIKVVLDFKVKVVVDIVSLTVVVELRAIVDVVEVWIEKIVVLLLQLLIHNY